MTNLPTAVLYTHPSGRAITQHSYSSGSMFRECSRKYKLSKLDGWRERGDKASLRFGECLESALQAFHAASERAGAAAEEFARLWTKLRDTPLRYTDKEGDWQNLAQMGREMAALYELKWAGFGYRAPRFQVSYRKEVFPGSPLAGLEFVAYVDMWAVQGGVEPTTNDQRPTTPLIVDIKTSAQPLPEAPRLLRLDSQLRSYAWVSGVPTVAFLNFVKARPGSFSKGDEAAVLVTHGKFAAGDAVTIINSDQLVGVVATAEYAELSATLRALRGKKLDEAKFALVEQHGAYFAAGALTKQRLQFLVDTIPAAAIHETGDAIGREMVAISQANKDGFWPQAGGIRFPDNRCLWCPMLGICSGDEKLVEEKLVQIASNPVPPPAAAAVPAPEKDKDWFDEL